MNAGSRGEAAWAKVFILETGLTPWTAQPTVLCQKSCWQSILQRATAGWLAKLGDRAIVGGGSWPWRLWLACLKIMELSHRSEAIQGPQPPLRAALPAQVLMLLARSVQSGPETSVAADIVVAMTTIIAGSKDGDVCVLAMSPALSAWQSGSAIGCSSLIGAGGREK